MMMRLVVWGLAIYGGYTLVQRARGRGLAAGPQADRAEMFEEAVIVTLEPAMDDGLDAGLDAGLEAELESLGGADAGVGGFGGAAPGTTGRSYR